MDGGVSPDLHTYWPAWIEHGAVTHAPDARPGAPHPLFQFYDSWWRWPHLDNILLVHFADLLHDLPGQIRRVAAFLEVPADDALIDAVSRATTFGSMKADSERLMGEHSFLLNEGTNGRWRDVLTAADLRLYEEARDLAVTCGIDGALLDWLES